MPLVTSRGLRAPRRRATVLACSLVLSVLVLTAGAAGAPMVEFPVPGTPDQQILQMEAGPDGVLWFLQTAGSDRLRLGLLRDDGSTEVFGALPGTAEGRAGSYATLHASPAGGAWTLQRDRFQGPSTLTYVDAAGRPSSSAAPIGSDLDFGVDRAGRAVLLSCAAPSPCTAYTVAPGGATTAATLPIRPLGRAGDKPDGPSVVRVARGTWFMADGQGGAVAFLGDDGALATVGLGPLDRFAGPGPGNDVWLDYRAQFVDADAPLPGPERRTIVRVSPDGTSVQVTGPAAELLPVGSPGSLLWYRSPLNDSNISGQIGVLEGRQVRVVDLPYGVAFLPVGRRKGGGYSFADDGSWYPTNLHRASDGAVWALAPGTLPGRSRFARSARPPSVITRVTRSGRIAAFAPPSALRADGTVDSDAQAVSMTPSTTGALWFVVDRGGRGARFARADPLSPPRGLLTWHRLQRRATERRRTRALVRAQLARDIVPSRRDAGVLLMRDSRLVYRITARYRAPGRLRVTWSAARRGSSLLIARAACPASGITVMTCEVLAATRDGLKLLSSGRRLKITLRGVFFLEGERPVRVTRTVTLQADST